MTADEQGRTEKPGQDKGRAAVDAGAARRWAGARQAGQADREGASTWS